MGDVSRRRAQRERTGGLGLLRKALNVAFEKSLGSPMSPSSSCPSALRGLRCPMPHLPTGAMIAAWPDFTPERPLEILVSGCLAGRACGVDGSTNGEHPAAATLLALPNVRAVDFCREDYAFGPGVAAALLIRSGIPVVSQRDYRTLGMLFRRLGRPDLAAPAARDHHETDWYSGRFGSRP